MDIEQEIKLLQITVDRYTRLIVWLKDRRELLAKLPASTVYGTQVDFNHPSHTEVIRIIRVLGGKWKKTPSTTVSDKIDYQTEIDGITVRCWEGEPPPSCKVIEVEEMVPERIVPAGIKKVRKIVCSGTHEQVTVAIATARAAADAAQQAG